MQKKIKYLIFLLGLFLAALFFLYRELYRVTQNHLNNPVIIEITKGQGTFKTAQILEKNKIISDSKLWVIMACIAKIKGESFKAGEYQFKPYKTIADYMSMITEGNAYKRFLTVPEGLTVFEIIKKLEANTLLSGNIKESDYPKEGLLLPETYNFTKGESRLNIIKRMVDAMNRFKQSCSDQPLPKPLKSWNDVLILASIVEKETSIDQERAVVARVYLNRLEKVMPLQADPTVIYYLTKGQNFNLKLLRADLKIPSPYNTYINKGLTPTPIACAGKKSILAVLKPDKNNYLYFVANGKGGHAFSETLKQHNNNVKIWRNIKVNKSKD